MGPAVSPRPLAAFWPVVSGLILALSLGALSACRRPPDSSATSVGANPGVASSTPAPEWFADETSRSGVNFIRHAGTNYAMPDQIGSGVALFDYDRDGRLDLYLVDQGSQPGSRGNRLYHQETDGRFRDASVGSGLDVVGPGMGAFAADVNNDGRVEVLVTEYGAVRMFENLGDGRFREVSRDAGVDNPRWATAASFLDFDRDGWLDLVIGNYVDYDPTQICHDAQGRREFCAPSAFAGTVTRLWRNRTGTPGSPPRFEDWTERSGLARSPGAVLGLIGADFDGDGWPDIFCADDGRPNRLYLNRHDGTFVEEAVMRGLAYNAAGRTAANMGVVYADLDGDAAGDLFVTHLTEEFHGLYRQDRPGLFVDAIANSGLPQQTWRGTGFGAVGADFDADGRVDLAFVNGLVRRATPGHSPVVTGTATWWAPYAQKAQLFANLGGGRFRDISPGNAAWSGAAAVGRSLAVGDLNNDGAPDLVVGAIGGPVRLLHNRVPNRGHWLRLRLTIPGAGGRDAVGAEAVVRAGGTRWWAVLQPATSYLASHEPVLHFGLGAAHAVDPIRVRWPEGFTEEFPASAADRTLELRQGTGRRIEP